MLQKIQKSDILINIVLLIIVVISVLSQYSLSFLTDTGLAPVYYRHILFIIVGYIIYIFAIIVSDRYSMMKPIIISFLILSLIGVLMTYIWGNTINGATRWLNIFGVSVQPSELLKIALILFYASISDSDNYKYILSRTAPVTVISLILVFFQPHGSMAIIIMLNYLFFLLLVLEYRPNNILGFLGVITIVGSPFIGVGLLYKIVGYIVGTVLWILGGLVNNYQYKKEYFLITILSMTIGISGLFLIASGKVNLFEHQQDRIRSFIGLNIDEESTNNTVSAYNLEQSLIAIGSGMLTGRGFGNGIQSRLYFLPEYSSDFVFSAIGEEVGYIGSIIIVLLYIFLIIRILNRSELFKDRILNIYLILISFKLLIEVFVNIGTSIGLVPPTGVPLPIISMGGTAILVTFFSLGTIQGIIADNRSDINL